MGAAWGVAPAIARVHAYLMARQAPLTEREVREALGLSHRAASLALAEAEAWGLVERVSEPRRVGRRGPAGTAYQAIGDHWRWFGRVVAERKVREGDPIIDVLERTGRRSRGRSSASTLTTASWPRSASGWRTFLVFVRLFDRAVGPRAALEPRELERGLRLLGEVPTTRSCASSSCSSGLDDERRARPRRGAQPPLADGRPPGDEAHVRGRPNRQPLSRAGGAQVARWRRPRLPVRAQCGGGPCQAARCAGRQADRRRPFVDDALGWSRSQTCTGGSDEPAAAAAGAHRHDGATARRRAEPPDSAVGTVRARLRVSTGPNAVR